MWAEEAQPRRQLGGTESFPVGGKLSQTSLTVTSYTRGLLVTISLWTFHIFQIPLTGGTFISVSRSLAPFVSLSPGLQGLGFRHRPLLSEAQTPMWGHFQVGSVGCLLSTSESVNTKSKSSRGGEPGGAINSFKNTRYPSLSSPLKT